jgi:hypothetical protein
MGYQYQLLEVKVLLVPAKMFHFKQLYGIPAIKIPLTILIPLGLVLFGIALRFLMA